MTVTYTITDWATEGNKRVNYGHFTMTSAEVTIRSLDVGLRLVHTLEVWDHTRASPTSGVAEPAVTFPVPATNVWPALNTTSGYFTIQFTSSIGPIFWKARGTG